MLWEKSLRSLVFSPICHHVILQLLRDILHDLQVLQSQTEGGRGQQQPLDSAWQLEVCVTRQGEIRVPSWQPCGLSVSSRTRIWRPGLQEHQCGHQDGVSVSRSRGLLPEVMTKYTKFLWPWNFSCCVVLSMFLVCISNFRTTKRVISITSLHHNDQVPLYTRGHDATSVTKLEEVTTAYPSLDRETLL